MSRSTHSNDLHIALLGATPPPVGGIASWTLRMLSSKCFNGAALHLVDETMGSERSVYGKNSGKKVASEIKRCKRIWRDLRKVIISNDVSVVHSNIPAATTSMLREIVCARIAKRLGSKFVIHFHCTVPVIVASKLQRFVLFRLLSLSDAVIVLNSQSKQYIDSVHDIPTFVVPNFISTDDYREGCTYPMRSDGDIHRILYAGGIIESKGAFDLIEIAKSFPEINFRLAGSGEIPEEMEVPQNVTLLGVLDKDMLYEEYKSADCFAFITRFPSEGFSCSLLEAMSFSLPCIATNWAANKDMIGDDGGIIVEPGNLCSVVDAINVLQSKEIREKMGANNSAKVKNNYLEPTIINQYIEVYKLVS